MAAPPNMDYDPSANLSLRDREEYSRLLLDSTAAAICGVDATGLCTFVNQACARILGYASPSQIVGLDLHALIHHTRADGNLCLAGDCHVAKALHENRDSHAGDEILWRADGSSFPAAYWSYPIRRGGQPAGAVVTFLDISERRALEQECRRAQQRLRDVVGASPAVLFTLAVVDGRLGGVSWTSDNVREILGHSPETVLNGDFWLANVHPDDLESVIAKANADLFTHGHTVLEFRLRHPEGREQWIRSDVRMTRDETGQPIEAVGAWLDVTARKLAFAEHLKLRDQLERTQKLESIGRLAGSVAHDFNNLLTVINGYGDLILKKIAPDHPLHESVSEIRQAGRRAAELVSQLLLVSRQPAALPAEVNLNDIVIEVEKMLSQTVGEDTLIETRLSPSLGCVLADAGQCHRLLMNLAINAHDAMPSGCVILIETCNVELEDASAGAIPGPYVQLKVSDTGVGIPKDAMAHLFEPFFTTKKLGEGAGLGLATVYGIVQQSGGVISVESQPGSGAAFTIRLPRVDAGPTARPSQEPEQEPALASLQGSETILVVEDEEHVRKMAVRILSSYGYQVLEASGSASAQLCLENYAGPIHLMLTDVLMPGMTGPDLAARLQPSRPAMKVVFMSGYSEQAIADLPKPFSPVELAAKVRGVLGPQRPRGTILVVDDEPGIRSFLREVLTGAGYGVLEAASGKEAMRQVKTNPIDLVLMDLAMPDQEGIETIRILRRDWPKLKVIATSGKFANSVLFAAQHLGARASLAKPIDPVGLLDTVARILALE